MMYPNIIKRHTIEYHPATGAASTEVLDKTGRIMYEGDIIELNNRFGTHNYILYWNDYFLHWGLFPISRMRETDNKHNYTGRYYESIDEARGASCIDDNYILTNSTSWKKKNRVTVIGSVFTDDFKMFDK